MCHFCNYFIYFRNQNHKILQAQSKYINKCMVIKLINILQYSYLPSLNKKSKPNLLSILLLADIRSYINSWGDHGYFQCYKQTGFNGINLLLYQLTNDGYKSNIQTIQNALNIGLAIEVTIIICPGQSVEEEVDFWRNQIDFNMIPRIWVWDVNQSPCVWDYYSAEENCQYLIAVIEMFKALYSGLGFGIFTSKEGWTSIFKNPQGCPQVQNLPLWWFAVQDDEGANFNSYVQIGGWRTLT